MFPNYTPVCIVGTRYINSFCEPRSNTSCSTMNITGVHWASTRTVHRHQAHEARTSLSCYVMLSEVFSCDPFLKLSDISTPHLQVIFSVVIKVKGCRSIFQQLPAPSNLDYAIEDDFHKKN